MCAPRVVGTRHADALPRASPIAAPKCASGDARLQRGVPRSSRLRRRPMQDTPARPRALTVYPPPRGLDSERVPIAVTHPLTALCLGSGPRSRQALGFFVRKAAVDDQDRYAFRPGLALVLRHEASPPGAL